MSTATYQKARDAAGLTSVGEATEAFVEDAVDDAAFSDEMRTRLHWLYVSGKVQMRQRLGKTVPDALWEKHDALHAQVKAQGVKPSTLLNQTEHR